MSGYPPGDDDAQDYPCEQLELAERSSHDQRCR